MAFFAIVCLVVGGVTSFLITLPSSLTIHEPASLTIKMGELQPIESVPYTHIPSEINVDVDVSSLYNWNVKALYCYVVAEYGDNKDHKNEFVLFDEVLQGESQFAIKGEPKYHFLVENEVLPISNINLKVGCDLMPHIGWIRKART
ncbi:hypothetical protein PCE1_001046 [Barthelona sp. PCE]